MSRSYSLSDKQGFIQKLCSALKSRVLPCSRWISSPGREKSSLVLVAICIAFSLLSPFFATWQNLINVLLASATIGLLTIGAAFVIGGGGIDLSVGSVLAFSGAASSLLNVYEVPWYLVIISCLLSGVIIGLVNGSLISILKIPAFIVTLGMLSLVRGLALIITDGRPVYGLPEQIVFIGQGIFLGLPIPVWIFLVIGVVLQIILRKTPFGLHTLCIGDNEKAVYNVGINVEWHKIKLYMLSGFLAAMAGLVFMGRMNAVDPAAGLMYELSAITGAILGGAHLFGGRASVVGAMIGAIIMGVLQNGLTLLAVPSYYQQVAIGSVLILAVAMDRLGGKDS